MSRTTWPARPRRHARRDALTGDIDTLIAAGDLIESEGGLMTAEGS
ncbi:hypothetical protein ABZ092_03120 [Streptomyces bobili]